MKSVLIPNGDLPPAYSIIRKLHDNNYTVFITTDIGESEENVRSRYAHLLCHLEQPKNEWLSGIRNLLPTEEQLVYYNTIKDLCLSNNILIVLPANDVDIYNLSHFKSDFLSLGIHLCCPDFHTFSINCDKLLGVRNAESFGINVPETKLYNEKLHQTYLAELGSRPFIIKARFSSSSKYVWKVENAETFENKIRRLTLLEREPVIQEYIDGGTEFSCHYVTCQNGKVIMGFTLLKHRYLTPSWSTSVTVMDNNEFYHSCIAMIESYKQAGFWVVQAKRSALNGKDYFIEINTRFGNNSRILFEMIKGNLPAFCLLLHLKEPITNNTPIIRKMNGVALIEDLIAAWFEFKEKRKVVEKLKYLIKVLRLYAKLPACDIYIKSFYKDKKYVKRYYYSVIQGYRNESIN